MLAKIWSLLGFLLAVACHVYAETWVLSETHLGPLRLSKETQISVESLQYLFPKLKIKHKIQSGDSLNFHYFEIFSETGALLFTIQSFIEHEQQQALKSVKIDLLTLQSPEIEDQFGVAVGQKLEEVLRKRKENLTFGAAHRDNYLGAGKIWYSLSMKEYRSWEKYKGTFDISPNWITLEEAKIANPTVHAISWPHPRWE